MNINRHIIVYTILICIIAQGAALRKVCIETDCRDACIGGACETYMPSNCSHDFAESAIDTSTNDGCAYILTAAIDTNITRSYGYNDQIKMEKLVVLLQSTESDHPFSSFDFSKSKTNFLPIFPDETSQIIQATVLII